MEFAPSNITPIVTSGPTISTGAGFGGDNGQGFHSHQPVSNDYNEATEHTKDKFESSEPGISSDAVATLPKYLESPFTRYVTRPLSKGGFEFSYKPEDRSKTGVPLNPFWIRNDTWSMQNEADIFVQTDSNFVSAQAIAPTPQSPQVEREAYIENEEQPQVSAQPSDITSSTPKPPTQAAAGTVSGTVPLDQVESTPEVNPANPEGSESESPAKEKSEVSETSEPPMKKRRGRPSKKMT